MSAPVSNSVVIFVVDAAPPAALLCPLYIYPSAGAWAPLIAAASGATIYAVVNPSNGPGLATDPNYVAGIASLRAAGIKVLGYVYTSYGTRAISLVQNAIMLYASLGYLLDGLFVDEMASSGQESYYSMITAYAHSLGLSPVVANAGTSVPADYASVADVIVVWENPAEPTAAQIGILPRASSACIVNGSATLDTAFVEMALGHVSMIYVCDSATYTALPSYLAQLAGII